MSLTADQGSPQLIEPLHRRPRRVIAVIVILVVIVGLVVSIANTPASTKEEQGGNITSGLIWMGQIIISFIAVLSSIVELTGVSVRDLFSSKAAKANVEDFPFYVYQDYDKLLEYLFPDPKNPLLADRSIKYLPQISAETDAAFQDKGMVLIRGRSKTGKTREACELLRRWWYSGPTVLVVRGHVGLYPPYKIPENLPLRNLVIFFDDIDRYLGESSALKRLDETLQFFQEICHNRGEVRVIATVRQEEEFWDKLKFDSSQAPWNKFELIQLNPLSSEKALEVIDELSKMSGIAVEPELAKTLAEKNNGTFLNLALAFRGWHNQNIKTITPTEVKTFEGTLKNAWRRRYEELATLHPRVKPVYAAIDFMQSYNIPLRPGLINELATEMGMGKGFLSLLGWIDRLQNWFDMSPMFNWYRDTKRRRKGWIVLLIIGLVLTYLLLYAFLRFTPGDTQVWFFNELAANLSFQIRCLLPLWILLIPFAFYSVMKILRNMAFHRTDKALQFLLDAEIPMRGSELRPYENQFEGNGSTKNWQILNYAGEIREKKFSSDASQRLVNRYLELAEQLRTNGEFSPARKLTGLAQKISPNHPAPLFMLGKIEVDEGNFQNALVLLKTSQSLYRRSSNLAHAQERQALVHLFLSKYENAEQAAEKTLKEMPGLLTARWILGLAQIKQGKSLAGQKNCEIAASSNQVVPIEIQKFLSMLGIEQEEWFRETKLVLSNSAKSRPSKWHIFAGRGLAFFISVAVLSITFILLVPYIGSRLDQVESGIPLTTALLAIFPDSPAILRQRGYAYDNLGEYEKAIVDYTEAVRIDPDFAKDYFGRGYTYNQLGEYEKAVVDCNEAIRIDPKYSDAYVERGIAYRRLGEYDKAIADYTEAIRIEPEHAIAYNNRGYVYDNLGKYEKAIADYTEAIRIDPEYANAFVNRGYTYNQLGEYEKAFADFNKAIRIDPKNAYAYNNRGNAYNELGEYDKAIADFTEAIRIDPEYANAFVNRGYTYNQLGEYEKAIMDFNEAIRIDPESATAYNNRCWAYNGLGEYEKAMADCTEAIRIDPEHATAYNGRGYSYQALGKQTEADADFQKYEELTGQQP
jgi:tetratricopeptide (TPR) repeat protein